MRTLAENPPEGVKVTGGGMSDRLLGRWFCVSSLEPAIYTAIDAGVVDSVLVSLSYCKARMKDGVLGNTQKFDDFLALCEDRGVKVFMDCGAFTMCMALAKEHNLPLSTVFAWEEDQFGDHLTRLMEFYMAAMSRWEDQLWGYVEVDVGPWEQRVARRLWMEAQGIAPIPVFRAATDPWVSLDVLGQQYDRICMGGGVKARPAVRTMLFHELSLRLRQYPWLYVHALGMTWTGSLTSFPIGSCDSTTWLNIAKFGNEKTVSLAGYTSTRTNRDAMEEPMTGEFRNVLRVAGMAQYGLTSRVRREQNESTRSALAGEG